MEENSEKLNIGSKSWGSVRFRAMPSISEGNRKNVFGLEATFPADGEMLMLLQ